MANKIIVEDEVVTEAPKGSVIRPGDIRVKAERYLTFLSPIVSGLAASMLTEAKEKRRGKGG